MSQALQPSHGSWFCSTLTLLFIGLKLTGHIAWSWWWVLAPLWIPASFVFLILVIGFIVFTIRELRT